MIDDMDWEAEARRDRRHDEIAATVSAFDADGLERRTNELSDAFCSASRNGWDQGSDAFREQVLEAVRCLRHEKLRPEAAALLCHELRTGPNRLEETVRLSMRDAEWCEIFSDVYGLCGRIQREDKPLEAEVVERALGFPAGSAGYRALMKVVEDTLPDAVVRAALESPNAVSRDALAQYWLSNGTGKEDLPMALARLAVDPEPLVRKSAADCVVYGVLSGDEQLVLFDAELRAMPSAADDSLRKLLDERLENLALSAHERIEILLGARAGDSASAEPPRLVVADAAQSCGSIAACRVALDQGMEPARPAGREAGR